MECPHWKGTVGCNPKTRGLYYSQILGLPVSMSLKELFLFWTKIIYHVLLYNILFSLTNGGSQSGVKLLDYLRTLTVQLSYVLVLSTVSAMPSRVNLTRFLNYSFQIEFSCLIGFMENIPHYRQRKVNGPLVSSKASASSSVFQLSLAQYFFFCFVVTPWNLD